MLNVLQGFKIVKSLFLLAMLTSSPDDLDEYKKVKEG